MSWKVTTIVAVICAALGYWTCRYTTKPVVVTQTQSETDKQVKKNVVIDRKETINKDWTRTVETITKDQSQITTDAKTSTTQAVVPPSIKDWMVTGYVTRPTSNLSSLDSQSYTLSVQHRFIGPVFLGVSASSQKELGVSVGFEF